MSLLSIKCDVKLQNHSECYLVRLATDVMSVATVVKCCIDVVMQVKGCNCQ